MLGSRPPIIGFVIDDWRGDHFVVGSCKPSSPAARGGFRKGDLICSIAGLLPMQFIKQPLRGNVVRTEVVREGCELALCLEFNDAAPANPSASSADATALPVQPAAALPIPVESAYASQLSFDSPIAAAVSESGLAAWSV
jgi:hypothetical protein